jgi:hypothetical protein
MIGIFFYHGDVSVWMMDRVQRTRVVPGLLQASVFWRGHETDGLAEERYVMQDITSRVFLNSCRLQC